MKRWLSVLLALCLLTLPLFAFAEDAPTGTDAVLTGTDAAGETDDEPVPATMTLTGVPDVATFILAPITWCEIQIVPAVMTTGEGARNVYLVAIRGTGSSMQKANNVLACFLSSFNLSSNYYEMVRDAVYEYVPEGSAILMAGHSLGGMVAQQLSCTDEFTAKYELISTLNVGSPYVVTKKEKREGTLVRCVDRHDVIPKLGVGALLDLFGYSSFVRTDGGYLGDPDGAHNLSYRRADLWGAYDVCGVENGGATLTLNTTDIVSLTA